MQVLVKCYVPDGMDDEVSHAVIDFDLEMVGRLRKLLNLANQMTVEGELNQEKFMGSLYDSYDPLFIGLGDPVDLGLTDEQVEDIENEGNVFLPAKFENHNWNEAPMRPCFMMVMAATVADKDGSDGGRIYWYAYHKHGGPESKCETYSLHWSDLVAIEKELKCLSMK